MKSIIHENITDLEASKILEVSNGDTEKIKENWQSKSKTKIDSFTNYEQSFD